jgi:heterodisulfide reductase subunit B
MTELEIAKNAVKACLDELRDLTTFECPACKAYIDTQKKEIHETGCSIAVTLGLPMSDDPEGDAREDT